MGKTMENRFPLNSAQWSVSVCILSRDVIINCVPAPRPMLLCFMPYRYASLLSLKEIYFPWFFQFLLSGKLTLKILPILLQQLSYLSTFTGDLLVLWGVFFLWVKWYTVDLGIVYPCWNKPQKCFIKLKKCNLTLAWSPPLDLKTWFAYAKRWEL